MPSSTDLGHGPCGIKWKEMFKSMSKIIFETSQIMFFFCIGPKNVASRDHINMTKSDVSLVKHDLGIPHYLRNFSVV